MQLETDYLVVGAGASGMAFVDALIAHSDADVIMVDRRHKPGGHWHDAYPFVRLHQPAAAYGVSSTMLGGDRIDTAGVNAGMYELSSAAEICSYFSEVMDRVLLPSGQVRFLGMSEYREVAPGDHRIVSLLTGEEMQVKVRKRLVDATYIEPEIPATRRPPYEIEAGVLVVPPNDLVNLGSAAAGFTVLGAGKTAMDVCTWLLEHGVDPNAITWVRSRDVWSVNREWTQPLDLVHTQVRYGGTWMRAAAESSSGAEMALRLEEAGLFLRLDQDVPPTAYRGATISPAEVEGLRSIRNVVRAGRVRRVARGRMDFENGQHVDQPLDQVYVDCTATGLRTIEPRPVFESGRITLQYVTPGFACLSAATLGVVEAVLDDDAVKEHLSLPVVYTGHIDDLMSFTSTYLESASRRNGVPEVRTWSQQTRLNPVRGLGERLDDPRVVAAMQESKKWKDAALENLARRTAVAV
ncbi:NAD(P)-binding protein [Nocardioides ginsengisoli]|uniref:NAD(P)-binding protein n=1 Tax=Nocardioides ginsengisoli TaxID=363868 RepID=A0ABW3W7K5_9ACTN